MQFRRLLFVFPLTLSLIAQPSFRCGKERWDIKTGTDQGVTLIDLANPSATTIADLVGFAAPQPIPKDTRVNGPETTVWTVRATLTAFKFENSLSTGDSDYHLVIVDDAGTSMIAEIPFPNCVGSGSPLAAGIENARKKFDAQFTATSAFQDVSVPVVVTGVGMFDFAHGQRGRADN